LHEICTHALVGVVGPMVEPDFQAPGPAIFGVATVASRAQHRERVAVVVCTRRIVRVSVLVLPAARR